MTVRLTLLALCWMAGVWQLWSLPRPRPARPDDEPDGKTLAGVSVIVPARDEAGNLPELLASLAAQRPSPMEVVVVDDHSGDATAEVARGAGATVVSAAPLPAGWTGKCWACWTGAAEAHGEVLIFLDADCALAPGGLDRIAGERRLRGGLVSVQPFHVTSRAYEGLSAMFNVVSMMGVGAASPLGGRRPPTGAFGPCLATSRADYLASGGHEAVRGDVVEDVALARRYRAGGLPVACLAGKGTISFRMYPQGLSQLVEGWTKNFASGAGTTRPATFVLVFAWISGCISAAWYAVTALAGGGAGAIGGTAAAGVVYVAYAGQIWWMLVRLGRFGWWVAVAFPVPLAFFLAVFTRSLFLTHVRGEVRWRGRVVPTRGPR